MSRYLEEKPSLLRRVVQFFCSHWRREGSTLHHDDGEEVVTCWRCTSCGLQTWEIHSGWWR